MSTTQEISKYFTLTPEGEVVCAKMLLHLGSRTAVDNALIRMTRNGSILRVSRGLYVRPVEGIFGLKPPNIERVIESVAKLKGEDVLPAPAILANRFGLTTQVPKRETYWTSGRGRILKFGKAIVRVHPGPKWLFAIKNKAVREVASALNWMAENGDTEGARTFLSRLSPATRYEFARSRPSLPAWMAALADE